MSDGRDATIEASLRTIRAAVANQLGVERPAPVTVDTSSLVRFSDDLPKTLTADERTRLASQASELDPGLQGPFLLGGDLVVGGTWRCDQRWVHLEERVPESLAGLRVLDVGSNAGYDPFMFARRGAEYVMACEPFGFYHQAVFLESIYKTGVDFQKVGWEQLDADRHGTFDLVHCHGVLYHEPNPMGLLQRLRSMLAPGGVMYFGSMMLADPEQSEYLRFVPGSYYGDETWWFVPGRLALRWMLEVNGLRVADMFGEAPGPAGDFPVVNGYWKVVPMEPVSHLAVVRKGG